VRGVRDARSDRFGIEISEKEQRFGRDAVIVVESQTGAATRDARAERGGPSVHATFRRRTNRYA
jgi:hypothetical protein